MRGVPSPCLKKQVERIHYGIAYASRMTKTTAIRPADPELRSALWLGFGFAAIKLLFHTGSALWQRHLGYGYFRDEFYYIMCGRRLAWGYVDHGPLVAVQARLAETLFGHSLAGLRVLSALGGALRVLLTGLLCWAVGGRRSAQALAMLMVLTAPMYLGSDGYLSMNSWESGFWMPCLLTFIMLLRDDVQGVRRPGLWRTVFGISAGLGLLNKPSMAFFLASLGVALLLTPQRRLLFTRQAAVGIALMLVIVSPNLLWQVHNHWPTLEFLHNGRVQGKNLRLNPLSFIANQIFVLGPWSAFVWLPGLVHLLRRGSERWLGLTYLIFLALMIAMGAKDYYVTPVYPVLFAAGGVAWQQRFAQRSRVKVDRIIAFPVAFAAALLLGALLLPLSNSILRPETFSRYRAALHLPSTETEAEHVAPPLPQFYADRFGWQEEADTVTRIVRQLSPADRAQAAILCSNYGEAGALEFLGHGLPPVLSGHNTYWLWGSAGNVSGQVLIAISGESAEHLRHYNREVTVVGHMGTPWSMPYEHRNIYLLRAPLFDSMNALWPQEKDYI